MWETSLWPAEFHKQICFLLCINGETVRIGIHRHNLGALKVFSHSGPRSVTFDLWSGDFFSCFFFSRLFFFLLPSQRWEETQRGAVPAAARTTRPGTACRASRAAPTARTTPPVWPRRTAPYGWPCCPSNVSVCWLSSSAWSSSTISAGTRCAAPNYRPWLIWTLWAAWFFSSWLCDVKTQSKVQCFDPNGLWWLEKKLIQMCFVICKHDALLSIILSILYINIFLQSIRASGLVLLEAILCGALLLYFPVSLMQMCLCMCVFGGES